MSDNYMPMSDDDDDDVHGLASIGSSSGSRQVSSSTFQQQQQGQGRERSASSIASAKAKELSESASKWFKSTKEWLMTSMEGGNEDNHNRGNAGPRHEQFHDEEPEIDPSLIGIPLVQNQVVDCRGTIVSGEIDPSKPWSRALYRTLVVHVPNVISSGEGSENNEFVVALPTGEARLVSIPPRGLRPGDALSIAYRGCEGPGFGVEYVDEDDTNGEKPKRNSPDERLLDFYRRHNPEERDALLQYGPHGLGVEVFDGEFGAHIHHAVFVGVQTMLAADDVITTANGEAIQSVQDFQNVLTGCQEGDFVSITVLRKSPAPKQRCPAGHELVEVGPRDPLPMGSECNRCGSSLWKDPRVRRCSVCDWNLCSECYASTFENMNTSRNANRGDPEWAKDYEEAFGKTLTFSSFDNGTKVRIFWDTTGVWWLGEVLSYVPGRGHEILYEEIIDGKKQFSKQNIPDMAVRTYRVLKKKPILVHSPKKQARKSFQQEQSHPQPKSSSQDEDFLTGTSSGSGGNSSSSSSTGQDLLGTDSFPSSTKSVDLASVQSIASTTDEKDLLASDSFPSTNQSVDLASVLSVPSTGTSENDLLASDSFPTTSQSIDLASVQSVPSMGTNEHDLLASDSFPNVAKSIDLASVQTVRSTTSSYKDDLLDDFSDTNTGDLIKTEEQFTITEDEKSLLEGIEADLSGSSTSNLDTSKIL